MNRIKVKVNFEKGICDTTGINLITGDYNSTKMVFDFVGNPTGIKVLEMKSPSDNLTYVGEIQNNEVILVGKKEVTTIHNEVTYTKYLDTNDTIYWYDPLTEKIYDSEWSEQSSIDLNDLTVVTEDVSLFNEEGYYVFEISLYGNNSKLTSVHSKIKVKPEQVVIDGEVVTQYLPIFDQLLNEVEGKIEDMEDATAEMESSVNAKLDEADDKIEEMDTALSTVNQAITETNNLNIDVNKVNKTATIDLTKKDGTTKSVNINDGVSLQFMWQGTSLGIKTDDMENYVFVNIQGPVGPMGPQGSPFQVKKTYATIQLMINDYDNMEINDYVMISGNIEEEDNAKLFVKTEQEDPTYRWQYLADFSGASGIRGPQGASVTSAEINTNGELVLTVE